jgi:hypothetical protein
MVTISVDYSRVGRSPRFSTHVFAEERAALHVGDLVTATGDDVEERKARVIALCDEGRSAEFEFVAVRGLRVRRSGSGRGR